MLGVGGEGEYKWIVCGDDCDNVNSLVFEVFIVLYVRREMFDLTSRCECSRNSKQNDFLPLERLHHQSSFTTHPQSHNTILRQVKVRKGGSTV